MNDSVPVNYEALSSRSVFILDTILANNSQQGKYDQCDYLRYMELSQLGIWQGLSRGRPTEAYAFVFMLRQLDE